MLHIGTWHWGTRYGPEYVSRLSEGLLRNLTPPYVFHVFHPEKEDAELLKVPGCFCRLRMFDPDWQEKQGIRPGDRLVCMDLDSIVTGRLDPLFRSDEPFQILQGANQHRFKFNGSIWSLIAGYAPHVWGEFSLSAASSVPYADFPDDQQWMEHKIAQPTRDWAVGKASGIYAFQKPGWPSRGTALPPDARLVVFPGWRDPSLFIDLPWVKRHWIGSALIA